MGCSRLRKARFSSLVWIPASLKTAPAVHAEVGMVFQFPEDQIVSTTVEEDAAFGPENLALTPDEIRRRVEEALQEVGLWEMRSRPPHLLSAGQTQRLALAGVLAMHPHCIVFDEASTMLDPVGRRMMINTMQRLHEEGTTILFITHFMDEAVLADRLMVLDHGRVVKDGSPAQIFADPTWLSEQRLDLPPAALASARIREVLPDLPEGLLTLTALLQALPAYMGNYRAAAPPPNMEPDSEKRSPLIEVRWSGIYLHAWNAAGTPRSGRGFFSCTVGTGAWTAGKDRFGEVYPAAAPERPAAPAGGHCSGGSI